MSNFSENFKRLLDLKKERMTRVSKHTGISEKTLWNWKNGMSTPKYEHIITLSDYFHIQYSYWFTGSLNDADITQTDQYLVIKEENIALKEENHQLTKKYAQVHEDMHKLIKETGILQKIQKLKHL